MEVYKLLWLAISFFGTCGTNKFSIHTRRFARFSNSFLLPVGAGQKFILFPTWHGHRVTLCRIHTVGMGYSRIRYNRIQYNYLLILLSINFNLNLQKNVNAVGFRQFPFVNVKYIRVYVLVLNYSRSSDEPVTYRNRYRNVRVQNEPCISVT